LQVSASELSELLAAAEEGARQAGELLADRFEGARTVEYKGRIDLVTDADRASEAELLSYLRSRFPNHSILSEERGLERRGALCWIVDPLDGTTNYSHRVPHFCVSVAVQSAGELLAAAIYDPIRRELFSAARGAGAQLNGKSMRASAVTSLDRALLCTGFPYDVRERPEIPLGLFNRLIRLAQGLRRIGSAALDLAYVAAGRFDGFFEFGLKPWDVGAGALLVMEAGGSMRRIDGQPLDLAIGDVIASCPGIEAALQQECSRFLEECGWTPRPKSYFDS
jgi:myo-inositol-1(or 4)-monophosphatase